MTEASRKNQNSNVLNGLENNRGALNGAKTMLTSKSVFN